MPERQNQDEKKKLFWEILYVAILIDEHELSINFTCTKNKKEIPFLT